jgi:putative methionine-R-sulfoxide reductase with GAF domain
LLERAGVVVVGIDLKTELERIVVLEGLTSDLELVVRGVRVGAYAAGSGAWAGPASNGPPQDGPDALDGWVNDHYFRSRSITLGSSPARLLLVHSVDDTGRVTALGLIVMGSGMLFTLLSVSVLNGMMIRSIGRAVAALSRAARCLGNGELDKPVPPVPHPLTIGEDDELGVLAESFEEMVGGVRGLCADLEAEIEELEAELNTVAEIARAVASSLDSRAILHETVRILKTRLKAVCPGLHHVSIYLVEGNPRATTLRKAVGEAAGRPNRADVWVPLGTKSPVGMAVRSRRPEAVQNVKAASAHLKPPLLLETNSAAAAPLLIGDGLVGALSVESNQPNAFSPRALMLLATLADQIATGLQRARRSAAGQC